MKMENEIRITNLRELKEETKEFLYNKIFDLSILELETLRIIIKNIKPYELEIFEDINITLIDFYLDFRSSYISNAYIKEILYKLSTKKFYIPKDIANNSKRVKASWLTYGNLYENKNLIECRLDNNISQIFCDTGNFHWLLNKYIFDETSIWLSDLEKEMTMEVNRRKDL